MTTPRGQEPTSPEADHSRRRKYLENILQQALMDPAAAGTVDPADLARLREVARRRREWKFCLQPVSVELVQALLESYFHGWSDSAETWRAMSAEVAQSLFDDPQCHERLKRLWLQLTEA
jgi:hypothetical protein